MSAPRTCDCGAELPERYLTGRCASCCLDYYAPRIKLAQAMAAGKEYVETKPTKSSRWEISRRITAAIHATAMKDYEAIRAKSADPYTLHRLYARV